uniref:Uncharacterized protein n=1 Tax=viral metagenome TaxID=1070528 RepID=A0A6M3J090_9ZZZZ
MGTLRESNQLLDNPRHSDVLLDDINETITIVNQYKTFDVFDYDQYDQLAESGRRGARAGRKLKNAQNS